MMLRKVGTGLVQHIPLVDTYQLEQIVSSGQTGINQLGLEVARSLGIPTSGIAPKEHLRTDSMRAKAVLFDLICLD